MKFGKYFLMLFCFSLLVSCSKDEDTTPEPTPTSPTLVGQWAVTAIDYSGVTSTSFMGATTTANFTGTGFDMDLNIEFTDDPNAYTADGDYSIKLVTMVQGQSIETDWMNPGFIGAGTWEVDGNTLTISSNGETQDAEIVELSETTFVMGWSFSNVTLQNGATVNQNVNGTYTFTKQ